MPQIKIDGKECSFEGKKSILEVALENGVEIPHYCYHPGMSIVASCRICLAEVAQPDREGKLQLIPKLMPTCQTPAVDGAEVHLCSPKAQDNQKAVMEYLLLNHPLDCPVCDQAGECGLQDYSYKYGRSESRFEEAKNKQPKKDLGPNVLLYSDRCIMCSRCVRFTKEITGTSELGIVGRGCTEQIDVASGHALDNPLSGCVVDVCPVGAMIDKDFLMNMRVWNLTRKPSIDGLTASGDNLWVDSNQGKVYRIKPRTNAEVNQWWISDEIRYSWKAIQSDEERLVDARLAGKAVELAEALEAAANNLKDRKIACVLSPMLPTEEVFALAQTARMFDPDAVLVLGPVVREGEDRTFPGGYTMYAEKAPNARGVRRVLEQLGGNTQEFEEFTANPSAEILLLSASGPHTAQRESLEPLAEGRTAILLDSQNSKLASLADIVLPTATWLEKAGCFENIKGRIQSFEAAIPMHEGVMSEGQVAYDLQALANLAPRQRFVASQIRQSIDGLSEVHAPAVDATPEQADGISYEPISGCSCSQT